MREKYNLLLVILGGAVCGLIIQILLETIWLNSLEGLWHTYTHSDYIEDPRGMPREFAILFWWQNAAPFIAGFAGGITASIIAKKQRLLAAISTAILQLVFVWLFYQANLPDYQSWPNLLIFLPLGAIIAYSAVKIKRWLAS